MLGALGTGEVGGLVSSSIPAPVAAFDRLCDSILDLFDMRETERSSAFEVEVKRRTMFALAATGSTVTKRGFGTRIFATSMFCLYLTGLVDVIVAAMVVGRVTVAAIPYTTVPRSNCHARQQLLCMLFYGRH